MVDYAVEHNGGIYDHGWDPDLVVAISRYSMLYPDDSDLLSLKQIYHCAMHNPRQLLRFEPVPGTISISHEMILCKEVLSKVYLPEGLKKIDNYTFSGCTKLTDLFIPDSVTEIGSFAFEGCVNLETIHLPTGIVKISEGMFKNCKSLKKVFLPDSIEMIEDYAFSGCNNMQKPWIPKNIKFISEHAFPLAAWYDKYYVHTTRDNPKVTYDFSRFISSHNNNYQQALREIKSGRKVSHWMWYIFPQLKGFGKSSTSDYYGICDLNEARAFLEHSVLGAHLIEISMALLELDSNNATDVMGRPDDLKLKSSMTLFSAAKKSNDIFQRVLDKYFDGIPDYHTLKMLGIEGEK